MANKYSSTSGKQEKAYLEIIQNRLETLLPEKTDIPASISIQEAERLKDRVRELEVQLEKQTRTADIRTTVSIKEADSLSVSHTKKQHGHVKIQVSKPNYGFLVGILGSISHLMGQSFRGYGLRTKLIASFLLLTIVPLAILGWQTYSTTHNILEQQIKAEILRSSLSTSVGFQEFLDAQFTTLRSQLRATEITNYMSLPEFQRDGSEEETLVYDKFRSFSKTKPTYIKSYSLLDKNGIDLLDTNQSRIGTNFVDQDLLTTAVANNGPYASGLILAPNGGHHMYFVAPLTSKSGELLGFYVVTYNPNVIQSILEQMLRDNQITPSANELTYLIDGYNYFVLGHSLRVDLVFKSYLNMEDATLVKLQEEGVINPDKLSRLVVPQPEVVTALSKMETTSQFRASSYDDVVTESAAVRLANSDWVVVTSKPISIISSIIQSQTRSNVSLSLSIIVFVIVFALLASNFFTEPIIQLTRLAENISTGDLVQKADIRRNDEFGVLARTFNTMTDQIQALVFGLEQRVAERTHDIELATEVGRYVSEKIGDLTAMLAQSVELIRARYELYYTQIYLVDSSGRSLVLRAGTGEAGGKLVSRGHRLEISSASLNGRAASDRHPILVADTQTSANFLPNPLLPLTRSELAVPLIANNEVVGVLDMQSEKPERFSEANLAAFQVLAGQLAIAIQNAALFNQAEESQLAVEEQARRLTRSGWQEFMNAIERSEAIGYVFNQNEVLPLPDTQNFQYENTLTIPIMIAGANVGQIQLADEADRKWTTTETEIAQAAMSYVGQHIETLRLLAQADRYRSEAEQVSRRLTSEGWKEYLRTRTELADGYMYSKNKVQPLNGNGINESTPAVSYPLVVRDEPIGELMLETVDSSESHTNELVAAVVEQLSDHIENLRLLEQAEQKRLELETVATVSSTASTVLDPDKLLQAVVDLTKERFGLYHAHIYLADDSWQTLLMAAGAGEIGRKLVAEEHAIPMGIEQSLVARAAREGKAVITNDVRREPGFLPNPLLPETRAEMAIPMIVGDKVLGVFDVQSNKSSGFTKEDANIYTTLASQVAVALQNARLYVEQAATVTQLRELDRLKSSFLANMSHELRTPLNSILGFTDVMLEGLDGDLTEYMDNDLRLIHKNGQHLLHLINDVLDMAKIESGRMNLHPEKFRIHSILDEVTSITSTLASEKNLALFIEEDSDQEIEVFADNTRLRQVMINLVNNSIKFTEKGKIALHASQLDGARVLITVKDTGIGIPPEQLEDIFQEFTQVDTSTTRKVGGTGLGLPISRRLIEMHGGRLWAESTGVSGEGSTFFVELPIEARITEVIEKQEK